MRFGVSDMTLWSGASQVAGPDDVVCEGATADSRAVQGGQLFVGVPGENTDGGLHAAGAIAAGAAAVLVSEDAWTATRDDLRDAGAAVLAHHDPVQALAAIGRGALQRLGARVVAITGSYGKTSTKDSTVAVLRAAGVRAEGTPGNRNTEVGVPLSILGLPEHTEVAVIEMGMRAPGQIAELVALAPPHVAVITAIGPVHLELLGTIEAIAATKAEILGGLPADGVAIFPDVEPLLDEHIARLPAGVEVRRFGDEPAIAVSAGELKAWEQRNIAAAVEVAIALGMVPAPGAQVTLERSAMRGIEHPLPGGGTLIEDCYNANPPAMDAALADLCRRPGRHVAVLADMLELGPDELDFHRGVGERARAMGVDLLVAVGPRAVAYPEGAEGVECVAFADTDAAVAGVPALIAPGDVVLVKGSRGMAMERVARAITGGG
ncbi:MAG: UDP-N-acetylmuramoyl-tripeptide--D-alanyl-D-alanine ligase [Actinobacteria bacterium]|nr:UDP-N-acetylmuramoyl-tripeptide--D-alanyl-D-alanine ligase [Actinomycetota bacterium]